MDRAAEEKTIIYKRSGGQHTNLCKNDILETMDQTYQGWREDGKTFVFPVTTEPTYDGPLTEDTSDYDKGLVKGYHSEVDVLWALKKVSLENSLGLRLFHGIPIMEEMFAAIARAFDHTETGIENFIDFNDFKDLKGMKDIKNINDLKKSKDCK